MEIKKIINMFYILVVTYDNIILFMIFIGLHCKIILHCQSIVIKLMQLIIFYKKILCTINYHFALLEMEQ